MSLHLYFGPGACSFVPHVLLEAVGLPFEAHMVKLHKGEQYGETYKALNPRSQVPVLVDGDQVITQIVAIVSHLNELFPDAHILPSQPLARTRVLETLAWMNNTVHTTFTHIFMPHKFSDNPQLHEDLKRYNSQLYRDMLGELQALVVRAKAGGQPWLAGAWFGPLDAYALTLTRWGTLVGVDPLDLPVLWEFVQKVAAEPAARRALERERLQLNLFKA